MEQRKVYRAEWVIYPPVQLFSLIRTAKAKILIWEITLVKLEDTLSRPE